jgi:hypothetical protein
VSGLAAWFDGSSAPVNIGLVSPQKERLDPVEESDDIFSQEENLTQRPRPEKKRSSMNVPTMFKAFRRSTTTLVEDGDELSQLDVEMALFPQGRPDNFSPASFKNLEMNADGTIRRFQQAYREQGQALKAARSAKNVQADELEAAQMKGDALRQQLEEMAERATRQEQAITELNEQLAAQRRTFEQSIRMVPPERAPYRRNRSSDVSTSGESELGSEISSVASIFSEPMSAAPSITTMASPMKQEDCPKCHGMKQSDAWDVVNVMRAESAGLKNRIHELENAQEDALDFLNGLKVTGV